jgi:catechol 2,3-dioxygenase-like lactoylglutathione lyase family enzyme
MRAVSIFIGGIAVGLGVQFAIAQGQNSDIVRVNHVGLAVPDLDAAVTYYTETMGFPEVFRVDTPSGDVALVYVQVSENTFVEIQPVNENRPQGISHFGVHVDNMDNVIEMYRSRGVDVEDSRLSSTNAILSNIYDPWGIRMELAELPPESLHRQAMDAWR